MKKNRLAIIITAILIVIAGVLLWNNRYLSSLRDNAYDFTVRDTASVTRMFFADKSGNQVLLERNENGYIVSDEKMKTNIDGVYVAGDIRNTPLRQIVTACSDGAIAATAAFQYIKSSK